MEELEIIDADSRKVAAMLSALPRVEAPANFEFRVKAGIAKGAPSRSTFMPILKTAAQLGLILAVVTFGLLYSQFPSGTEGDPLNNAAMSGPVFPPVQIEPAPAPPSMETNSSRDIAPVQPERVSTERDRAVPTRRTASSSFNNRTQGGSKDWIQHQGNVIMPPGTEAANPRNRNANISAATMTETPVREFLGVLGVEGDFAGGGWKVKSVKENSLGSRAKIATGDVIEAVDGQPVKNETKLKGGAKTFTIRRDGKVITLSSGN